jgi:ABC-type amino acid transport substrate-binding protein
LGKKLKIVDMQFDGLILGISSGKFDFIMAGISITPDRVKKISMIPYHGESVDEMAFVFWKEAPLELTSFEALASFDQASIAVQQGTWQEIVAKKIPGGVEVHSFATNAELFMNIKYGKSTAVLFEKAVALALHEQMPELTFTTITLPPEFHVLGEGIGVHKQNSVLTQQIRDALADLRQQGILADLEKKWFRGKAA